MADWREKTTWYTYDTPFKKIAKILVEPLFNAVSRLDFAGYEHFPTSGPCIVAANHFSSLDILYMGLYLPRYPHFMAKRELYKNPLLGWTIRQLGSFPVRRGEGDMWAMAQAGRVLADGQVLFLFPEGTRGKHKAELKQAKNGVIKLALQHGVSVVPAAIWGTEKFKVGWKCNPISIHIGQPLDVVTLAGPKPYKHEVPRQLTELMMRKIAELLPPEYRGMYS
jgi:1-acyl-sn-glycerol-3-phosphate acyltransferase